MIKRVHSSFAFTTLFALVIALFGSNNTQATELSPQLNYLIDGQTVGPWKLAVGNKKNWHVELAENGGKTVGGNLVVSPSEDKSKKALLVHWKGRKGIASFGIGGPAIDISLLEKDVAVVFDLKFEKKVRDPLVLHMDCTHPCRGTIPLKKILAEYPTNEWFTLPIPLTWFAQNGTELNKVDTPFKFETKGKIKMHIANVRLLRLPK